VNKNSTLGQFIRASWFSQIEVFTALFLLVGLVFYVAFSVVNEDSFMQHYFALLRGGLVSFSNDYEYVGVAINSNEYIANATIFAFWAIVGLLVYYLGYILFTSERNFSKYLSLLLWKQTDVATILEETFVRVTIRVAALIMLLLFLVFFVSTVLPYVVVSLNITSEQIFPYVALNIAYASLGLFLSLHVIVVLLRCLLLRQRLLFAS